MKRIITAAVAALSLTAVAPAVASGKHWCRQGDPPILASANTSCSFAGNVYTTWVQRGKRRVWRERVLAGSFHWYLITCRRTSHISWYDNTVTCTGPLDIWFRSGMP